MQDTRHYTEEEYREFLRLKRELAEENRHLLERLSAELYFDIQQFTEIHHRLSKEGCTTVDVWLSTGKVWPVGSAERGHVPESLELFLRDQYGKIFVV